VDTRPSRPWTEPGQDPELLQEAQRGELSALLRIYNTHRLALWRACLALTRHVGDAELLFQETLVHATQQLRAAPARQPLLPWLVHIARQIDTSHARGRTPASRTAAPARRPNGEAWLPGARGAQHVEVEQRALHGYSLLHPDDQWLLALRLFERLSYAEISRVTGLSVARVTHRIAVAREYVDQVCQAEDRAA